MMCCSSDNFSCSGWLQFGLGLIMRFNSLVWQWLNLSLIVVAHTRCRNNIIMRSEFFNIAKRRADFTGLLEMCVDNTFLLIHNTLGKNNLFFFWSQRCCCARETLPGRLNAAVGPDEHYRVVIIPVNFHHLCTLSTQVIHEHKKREVLSNIPFYQTQIWTQIICNSNIVQDNQIIKCISNKTFCM